MAVVGDASRVENEDERFRGREKGEGELCRTEYSSSSDALDWSTRRAAILGYHVPAVNGRLLL